MFYNLEDRTAALSVSNRSRENQHGCYMYRRLLVGVRRVTSTLHVHFYNVKTTDWKVRLPWERNMGSAENRSWRQCPSDISHISCYHYRLRQALKPTQISMGLLTLDQKSEVSKNLACTPKGLRGFGYPSTFDKPEHQSPKVKESNWVCPQLSCPGLSCSTSWYGKLDLFCHQ